jgi:hypothetical protein
MARKVVVGLIAIGSLLLIVMVVLLVLKSG